MVTKFLVIKLKVLALNKIILPFAASALALFLFAGASPRFVDDTFITLQYARNLIDFGQLTWHPSLPKVDGFTSLAHVLIISVGYWLGAGLIGWNSFINIAAALLILAMFSWATRNLSKSAMGAGLAIIAANAALLEWIGGGLDAVPYAAVFFGTYLTYENSIRTGQITVKTALILILLGMMRPEGIFVSLALLVAFWGSRPFFHARISFSSIASSGIVLAAIALQVTWRIHEYGHPLPNTYYAKMSDTRLLEVLSGLEYLAGWIIFAWGLLLFFTIAALSLGSRAYLRLLFVFGQIAVVVMAGGDPHPGFRFFLPVLPLLAMDIAWVIDKWKAPFARIAIICLALIITRQSDSTRGRPTFPDPVSGTINVIVGHWPMRSVDADPVAASRASAAREMSEILPDDLTIAATDVGVLAFFSGMPVLDTHGLNHPEISHLAKLRERPNDWGNYRLDYLIERDVPFVLLHFPGYRSWAFEQVISEPKNCDYNAGRISKMSAPFIDELSSGYLCLSIPSQSQKGKWLDLFVRKDRDELLKNLPEGTEVTNCLKRFREVCRPLG